MKISLATLAVMGLYNQSRSGGNTKIPTSGNLGSHPITYFIFTCTMVRNQYHIQGGRVYKKAHFKGPFTQATKYGERQTDYFAHIRSYRRHVAWKKTQAHLQKMADKGEISPVKHIQLWQQAATKYYSAKLN